jgi:hypothetical protein
VGSKLAAVCRLSSEDCLISSPGPKLVASLRIWCNPVDELRGIFEVDEAQMAVAVGCGRPGIDSLQSGRLFVPQIGTMRSKPRLSVDSRITFAVTL